MLYGCTLKDKKSTKELLENLNLPFVNQLAIKIKLTGKWKAINDKDFPIQLDSNTVNGGCNLIYRGRYHRI